MELIVIVLVSAGIYFIPTIVAADKKNVGGIFFLNLFFGWTVIFWVAAFIWACVSPRVPQPKGKITATVTRRKVAPANQHRLMPAPRSGIELRLARDVEAGQ